MMRTFLTRYGPILTGLSCGLWIVIARGMPWWLILLGVSILAIAINILAVNPRDPHGK